MVAGTTTFTILPHSGQVSFSERSLYTNKLVCKPGCFGILLPPKIVSNLTRITRRVSFTFISPFAYLSASCIYIQPADTVNYSILHRRASPQTGLSSNRTLFGVCSRLGIVGGGLAACCNSRSCISFASLSPSLWACYTYGRKCNATTAKMQDEF